MEGRVERAIRDIAEIISLGSHHGQGADRIKTKDYQLCAVDQHWYGSALHGGTLDLGL